MRQILLIEDEANIAEALRFLLSRDGWQISVCGDGTEALRRLTDDLPDLIILDSMLPGLSGLEVLTALRQQPRTASLPVLMLTAKGQDRDREAATRAGATVFMTKPFDNTEIRATVRRLLVA